jgi:chloramphenicol O-acetyltransferase type A
MTAEFVELDIDNWPRKEAFNFFRDFQDPFFNLTASVDVTRLYAFVKDNGLSFSLAALYYALETANGIREFRIRLVEGRLVEYDRLEAVQTVLNDDESFSFAYYPLGTDVFEFDRVGREQTAKYKRLKSFDVETPRLDLIYFSVIPWVSFTSFKHASRIDRTQTVPRIVFGKVAETMAGRTMPLSVEANHAIMDGFHVGRFYSEYQARIDAL